MTSTLLPEQPAHDLTPPSTPATAPTVSTAQPWAARTWLLLVVLRGALFLDGLDI